MFYKPTNTRYTKRGQDAMSDPIDFPYEPLPRDFREHKTREQQAYLAYLAHNSSESVAWIATGVDVEIVHCPDLNEEDLP